jgi:hypothetical protein
MRRDRAAVMPPRRVKHSPDELHQVIRLLMLCSSTAERQITVRRLYHRQTMDAVAAAMNLAPGRVRELMNSLLVRERNAIAAQRCDERLARLDAEKRSHAGVRGAL